VEAVSSCLAATVESWIVEWAAMGWYYGSRSWKAPMLEAPGGGVTGCGSLGGVEQLKVVW
jgi:hypothetical protein